MRGQTQLFGGKRFQVFVSSTFRDLIDERQQVIQALISMGCFPIAMEYFPASYEKQWEYIQPLIESSDFFVCLIGGKYGSCGSDGVSYTEREYLYAIQNDVPLVAFHHEDPSSLLARQTEETEEGKAKLKNFIELVKTRLCKEWRSKEQLPSIVIPSIIDLARYNRPGWVRGNEKSKEFLQLELKNSILQKRIEEYELLISKGPLNFYDGYDHVVATIESELKAAAKECQNDGRPLKIRLLGVCLHRTFPTLKKFLEELKYPIRVEVRLAILSKHSQVRKKIDARWDYLYQLFEADLKALVDKLSNGTLKQNIIIKLVKYSHMPNWHGVLIDYKHLFLGHCEWSEDGQFTCGQNPYERFVRGQSVERDKKIDHYIKWFDYCRNCDDTPKEKRILIDTNPNAKG